MKNLNFWLRPTTETDQGLSLPPGPAGLFLLGNIPAFRRDPLGLVRQVKRQYGDIAKINSIGSGSWYQLSHPADIEYVLVKQQKNYGRYRHIEHFKLLLGEGLVTTEGENWL